jgi:hypothetical protein
MQIDGQCHCGCVTYRAEIDPAKVSICHCTDCQSLTGSPYRVTVICSAEDVRLTGAAPEIYGKRGDNGRIRNQHFCGECGSPLFTSGEGGQWSGFDVRYPARRELTKRTSNPKLH